MEKNEKTCQSANKAKMANQVRDKARSPVLRRQARKERRTRRREHEALSVSGDERTWTAKARPGSHVAGKAVLGKQQTRFVLNILNLHPLRNPSRGLLRKVRARHMDVGDGSLRMKF